MVDRVVAVHPYPRYLQASTENNHITNAQLLKKVIEVFKGLPRELSHNAPHIKKIEENISNITLGNSAWCKTNMNTIPRC